MPDISFFVNLASILTAITAVGVLIFNMRKYRKQLNTQVFTTYTERYDKIMEALPNPSVRVNPEAEPPDESEELRKNVLRYLNLCSEEFFLKENGYLDKAIWKIWEGELIRFLNTPLMKREWDHLREEFEAYEKFRKFVDDAQE